MLVKRMVQQKDKPRRRTDIRASLLQKLNCWHAQGCGLLLWSLTCMREYADRFSVLAVPTWVKSAPMKACSMPIQTVIGISSCWLGFFRWYAVAESSCIPLSSVPSPRRCFSPYLIREKLKHILIKFLTSISNVNSEFNQRTLINLCQIHMF
jgi:hypothetical protein